MGDYTTMTGILTGILLFIIGIGNAMLWSIIMAALVICYIALRIGNRVKSK